MEKDNITCGTCHSPSALAAASTLISCSRDVSKLWLPFAWATKSLYRYFADYRRADSIKSSWAKSFFTIVPSPHSIISLTQPYLLCKMQYSGNNRGRGRGRARGSFQQYPPRSNVVLPPPRDMMAGLGAIIGSLDKDTLSFVKGADRSAPASPPAKAANSGEVTFDDVRPLGSYNWTDEPGKILVPGTDALC
jgi:hypothetical protein